MKKLNQAFFTCFVLFSVHLFSQNLLTNGDFESGGAGSGFTVPNYNLYTSTTGDTYPGSYAISNNPSPLNQYFISPLNDHTAGAGNTMMVVDGHTNSNASFWSAGDNASGLCGLTIGASYTFSYWIRTISSTTTDATTQPNIVVNFGNATGTIIYGNPTADLPTVGWQQVMYTFVPSAACVTINLVDVNTSPGGNDFALDDLEVVLQLCAPTVLSITNPDAVCSPNTVDITDPAITVGSIGGGTLTYWTDPAGTIPLVTPSPSAIDVSGTYYIRSSSGVAPNCNDIQPVLVTVKPITTPIFTPVPDICEGEVIAPLPTISNNGVVGTWSPAIDNTTTTTYTFTPDPNPNPNLALNGDFSQGNSGFSSSYTHTLSSDGTVVGVYGVTTNSSVWFNSLSSCNDNTGGGNFLVADASVSNGGNDSVWCQTIPIQAGENYIFSYFAQSVSSGSPANLEVTINGVAIGNTNLGYATCNWTRSSFPWNSGTSTSAEICIYDKNTAAYGNDFGIDDISFVPTGIQCAEPVDMTIVVNPSTTPTFDPVAPICAGDALAPLPTTSLESITGTWSPALDNTTTTIYTFTPDAGQCATITTLTSTVNPGSVMPTFDPVAPICTGETLSPLPITSLESITGTWSPALDNTTTTTYTFTPDAGQCTSSTLATVTITVNPLVTPTFTEVAPICSGETLSSLPTTSLESITGSWSPALDNTTTTTYTFTPDAGQCADSVMMTIVVNPIVTPTFTQVAPICSGDALAPLSTTSIEGITGTWSPALDNTATTTYTFTPDAGQCADSVMMTIVVNPIVTPTFSAVAAICSGDAFAPLPITSLESITGTWSPALDNTTTTTYTFTPDAGQCTSSTLTTVTITVNPLVTPTFTQVAPICSGETLSPLPTTSLESITGTWSPALDNTTTTTYTFTPDAGQCAEVVVMTIVVNTPIVPSFTGLQPICSGETAPVLVATSIEGITGSWNPAVVNNTTSATYTFTPDAGQCAVATTLAMTINQPTLTNVTCVVGEPFSGERTITVYATSSGNYEYQLDDNIPQLSPVFENVAIGTHTITVTDLNGCSASITTEVIVLDYPKFFTPNGDGINDNWNIVALSDQPDARIFIFDRYGKLLKQLSTVGAGWDGTFNGEQLPSTDYWFTVDYLFGESRRVFKAHFSLKR
ncbi:T9SS type B sorting domain-containing protein [Flavobacterium jumunjinense]|uniref:T9SS type B sorting domain-containing protein n=2 Tax=Flavobacterium jumunjinense TaxID=998845 RepID=A0ABV5GIG3_9FLAO|nr:MULTISPECIES: T9SS type B sorting domain-containing protein [Flavobacterium]